MALVGNRSVLHKSPGRFLNGNAATGGAIANLRSNFNKHGMSRNAFQVFSATSAQPYGYYGGQGAWVQPQIGGAVAGVNTSVVTLGAYGAGSMGLNTSGVATLSFSMTGVGSLISSASGVASISFGASGNIFASKSTSGVAGLSLGGSGQLSAIGHTGGTAPISFAASWAPYAVGWLGGTTADAGLTTTGIANAIWGASASINNDAGSMGQKLNSAASGGVDYNALAQAVAQHVIEGGVTMEQALRIILAPLAGKATGVGTGTETYLAQDGITPRVTATFDAAGNRTTVAVNGV